MSRRTHRLPVALLLSMCLLLLAVARADAAPTQHMPRAAAALFDFHSNLWVNLHQVLFHEAKLRAGKPERGLQGAPPLSAPGMSKQEATDWDAAVGFYAAHFGDRPQHGDDELITLNDALAAQPDDGTRLDPTGLPPELVPVLRSAAPIYRKYWWPAENQSNQRWIASQRQRVQELGPRLAAAMTKDLHQPWPSAPIRVDVCYYVVALGYAFTTLPPHTTFASSDPTDQDLSGFELLFHEASHTYADAMMNAVAAEGSRQHKDVGDLWHSVLFYTSGVELRRLLPADEQAGFSPYAYRYDVYRGRWLPYRHLLETDWQAYLDGKTDFDTAIEHMVADLPQ